MKMYAYILNEETKQVAVCSTKPNDDFFEAEVEQDYKGNWYLEGFVQAIPIDEVKSDKIIELKSTRDKLEEEPIEYNGNFFDYDSHSRDRISAAIIALEEIGEGASLQWTLADNSETTVTASDLRGVISAVANRSNELHIKYRKLKELVETSNDASVINGITFA